MRRRLVMLLAAAAVSGAAIAQPATPRTPDGRPDLQGVWEARWRTPLERPVEAAGPIIAAEKGDALVAAMYARIRAAGNQSPDDDMDWGPLMPAPGGGYRTSLIVSPADGKRPLTQAAKDQEEFLKQRTDKAEGPEARGLSERCLRASGGAPLGVAADQSYRQIIQTPEHVVIWTEGLGDLRIIDMSGRERPSALISWVGDSVGHWEGDILVVETRLIRPEPARPIAAPGQPERVVKERFQIKTAGELDYSYTIEDPLTFTSPLSVAFTLLRTPARMFESGCHEGNYGLANILTGARILESRLQKKNIEP